MSAYVPTLVTLLRGLALTSVLTVSSIAGLLYAYQGKLVYPANLPEGARSDETRPLAFGLPFEELWLKTPDGEKLQAWHIRNENPEKRSRVTVVMFQANAGNIAHRLPLAQVLFKQLQCDVFMLSYRGYGLSTGTPGEEGIKIDAQVAMDWVREHVANAGHGGSTIVLYGQSLGGAVAIDAAVRNKGWISGLILENTFLDIPALIPSVLPPARFFTFLCREIWSSRTRLPLLKTSDGVGILFLSGTQDELVPPSHMKELHKLCNVRDKEWRALHGGTHNDTCMKPGYFPTIASFLHRHFGHKTPISREALSKGFTGRDHGGEAGEDLTEGEKDIARQLDDDEDSDWERPSVESAGSAADGLRKRTGATTTGRAEVGIGAGGAGPGDIIEEELQTEGVRRARKLDGRLSGEL